MLKTLFFVSLIWIENVPKTRDRVKSLVSKVKYFSSYFEYDSQSLGINNKVENRELTMKNIALTFTVLLGSLSASNVLASQGNAEAGKAKAITCAACHGPDGNALITMYPKIAGQHADYIYKQLKEFKLGITSGGNEGRMDPVMSGMSMPLSDQDMKDLSAYFASLSMSEGIVSEDILPDGKRLFMSGDATRGIPSCAACHGPQGNGTSLANFPKISFQHPEYVKLQLEKFRDGTRNNDMNGMMRDIAVKLTDKDIEILSKYIGGLH